MQTEQTIRVMIVEDKRSIREGLALIINATDGYQCTGTLSSVEKALQGIGRAQGAQRRHPFIALIHSRHL